MVIVLHTLDKTRLELSQSDARAHPGLPQKGLYLGVWAAEGNENLKRISNLSERRWLHYLDEAKGSGTPENVTFWVPFLLPPRLLNDFQNPLDCVSIVEII